MKKEIPYVALVTILGLMFGLIIPTIENEKVFYAV